MMEKLVKTLDEAQAVVDPLLSENKWAITVFQNPDGTYRVQWTEHKKYIDHDGVERLDEIWTTKEGELKFIQDLEPEHAKNIIRMILRNEKVAKAAMDILYDEISAKLAETSDIEDITDLPPNITLH